MKVKSFVLALVLTISIAATMFVGCAPTPAPTPTPAPAPEATPDVKTSASIVDNATAFQNAISNKGTWIIATIKDISIDKELVLEGEYKNGKKDANGKDIIQRKIGLYTQDENRNVTARFTLTAPRITILSPMASIEHGTFKGDVYVSANNFKLIDAKIDGNLYFTTDQAQSTFTKDAASSVTGKTELKK